VSFIIILAYFSSLLSSMLNTISHIFWLMCNTDKVIISLHHNTAYTPRHKRHLLATSGPDIPKTDALQPLKRVPVQVPGFQKYTKPRSLIMSDQPSQWSFSGLLSFAETKVSKCSLRPNVWSETKLICKQC